MLTMLVNLPMSLSILSRQRRQQSHMLMVTAVDRNCCKEHQSSLMAATSASGVITLNCRLLTGKLTSCPAR